MISMELNPHFEEKIFVIDGANVCWHKTDKRKKPKLSNLKIIMTELRRMGIKEENILIFCDLSLRYDIDNRTGYYSWLKKRILQETPGGMKADEFILSYCLKHDKALIISNDHYKEYLDQFSDIDWVKKRRIAFMILENDVIFVPVLEKLLEVSL